VRALLAAASRALKAPQFRTQASRKSQVVSLSVWRRNSRDMSNERRQTVQFADRQALMADVFEVDPSEIHQNSTPDDISAWDSLRVLELLLAIEKQHGVFVSPE